MTLRVGAVGLLVILQACAHGHLDPATARIPGPVGRIEVAAAPDLPSDRIARYRELDGDRVIRETIESELTSGGLWQANGAVGVVVTVRNFRLRSTANAFWNGFFAGSDLLDGTIQIRRGDAEPEQIAFKFSGNEDEYFKFSSAARFRSLASALAREIRARVDAVR